MKHGPEALQKVVDRMLTEAATRLSAGKTIEASRSYNKAAQYAEQFAEAAEDAVEAESMRMRAIEYRSRSLALAKGRVDPKRSKPYEGHEDDDKVYTDEEADAQEQQILFSSMNVPATSTGTRSAGCTTSRRN